LNAWIVDYLRLMVNVVLYLADPSPLVVGEKPGGFYNKLTGDT